MSKIKAQSSCGNCIFYRFLTKKCAIEGEEVQISLEGITKDNECSKFNDVSSYLEISKGNIIYDSFWMIIPIFTMIVIMVVFFSNFYPLLEFIPENKSVIAIIVIIWGILWGLIGFLPINRELFKRGLISTRTYIQYIISIVLYGLGAPMIQVFYLLGVLTVPVDFVIKFDLIPLLALLLALVAVVVAMTVKTDRIINVEKFFEEKI